MGFEIPIAFCIYNRPETTRKVFRAIRRIAPKELLVIADGPRDSVPNDIERVALTRAIINEVDWPCRVQSDFSERNLGCRWRMATGLDWAFKKSERLIVLEDDCVPHPSFFGFCRELLDRYADDSRVQMISGSNFQTRRRTRFSYYFSHFAHIWGWAAWRSTWSHYDLELSGLELEREFVLDRLDRNDERLHWSQVFDTVARGEVDTWDFSLQYAIWKLNGLVATPELNLVTNIGFGPDATHTTQADAREANMRRYDLGVLKHPPEVVRDAEADRFTFERIFANTVELSTPGSEPGAGWRGRLARWLKRDKRIQHNAG